MKKVAPIGGIVYDLINTKSLLVKRWAFLIGFVIILYPMGEPQCSQKSDESCFTAEDIIHIPIPTRATPPSLWIGEPRGVSDVPISGGSTA